MAAKAMFRALDMRITVEGAHHVPRTGGAVLASNHISYLDFIFCGFGAQQSRRLVRFMAKTEVYGNPLVKGLMRGMHHIEVDRRAGTGSYDTAVAALRLGEIVGVFPEGTISRSFTIKPLKTGAARMATVAQVPLLPMAVWGGQRIWTKGRKRTLTRGVPISILIGAPLQIGAQDSPASITTRLKEAMSGLLVRAQEQYPDQPAGPADSWWLPAHLGGTAPTLEEAAALDAQARRQAAGTA